MLVAISMKRFAIFFFQVVVIMLINKASKFSQKRLVNIKTERYTFI